jgi:hypothetical protein
MSECPPPCPPCPTPATPPVTQAVFKTTYGPPNARDFIFGAGADTVMDADVNNAFTDAMQIYNPALFGIPDGQVAFMYLVAHFIRTNIQAVGGLQAKPEGLGVENQAEQVFSGGGAGGVSTNFVEPPPRVKRNPIFLQLWVTTYGQKYVMVALLKTTGAATTVEGPIDPGTIAIPQVPFSQY